MIAVLSIYPPSLRGDKQEVEAVEKLLLASHKKVEAENFELEVPIFRQFHREIIGKSGATIIKIRDQTQTRIYVPSPDDTKDTITVVGTEANCKKAQQMMMEIQDQIAKITTKDVTIPVKNQAALKGPNDRLVTSLMEEYGVIIAIGENRRNRLMVESVVLPFIVLGLHSLYRQREARCCEC